MSGAGMKILIVDDDPFVLDMLAIVLEDAGYAVVPASNGCEALEALDREGDMDLALTDMSMPGMDGLQLTREILSRNASLPVLLLTAHEDAQLSRRALESGVRRCLVKDEGLMDGIADVVEETLRG